MPKGRAEYYYGSSTAKNSKKMANEIIVTTRAELQAIVAEECNRLYSLLSRRKGSPIDEGESNALTLDKAVAFLAEQGHPITKNTIYQLVSKEEIPFAKFNGKLVFSRRELLSWAESRTKRHIPSRVAQAQKLAKTARKA